MSPKFISLAIQAMRLVGKSQPHWRGGLQFSEGKVALTAITLSLSVLPGCFGSKMAAGSDDAYLSRSTAAL